MKKQAFTLLFLAVALGTVTGGVVPLTFNANTKSSVTFSGTIPTYTVSNTGSNSSAAYADKYYTITSTGPRHETMAVELKGSGVIACKSTSTSTTITSTQSVQSAAPPSFLYNFSGKTLARTEIQSGSFYVGTSSAYPANTLLWLDVVLNISFFGTPTSYDGDFKLKYGNLVLIDQSYLESHNNQASIKVRAGQYLNFDFWHESYSWYRPLTTTYTLTFNSRVPEPTTLILLGLGGLMMRKLRIHL